MKPRMLTVFSTALFLFAQTSIANAELSNTAHDEVTFSSSSKASAKKPNLPSVCFNSNGSEKQVTINYKITPGTDKSPVKIDAGSSIVPSNEILYMWDGGGSDSKSRAIYSADDVPRGTGASIHLMVIDSICKVTAVANIQISNK